MNTKKRLADHWVTKATRMEVVNTTREQIGQLYARYIADGGNPALFFANKDWTSFVITRVSL